LELLKELDPPRAALYRVISNDYATSWVQVKELKRLAIKEVAINWE